MRDLFECDAHSRARDSARLVLRAIVYRITGKVAAAACGLSESHLSTALGDRASDRYLRDEHIDAILRLATDAERAEYWTARLTAYGLKPAAVAPRTPVERLARLEELAIRRFGAAGAELVDEERSRP